MVKILDLYCGMGGLSLGFALGLEGAEILGLDIDKDAVATYNLNLNKYGCRAEVQDVLKWSPRGDFDLIIGGSPCEPFSIANTKRRGEDHPLYPTFPKYFDIVLTLKPKAFLLENVKGLLTKAHRYLLERQLRRVNKHYKVKYKVLNASLFGVPQRRERLFILGIRKDINVEPSFPSETHAPHPYVAIDGRKVEKWISTREAIGDLLAIPPKGLILSKEQIEKIRREREDTSRHFSKMAFPDNLDMPSRTISSHTVEGTKRETIVIPVSEHVITKKGGWDNEKSNWGSRIIPLDKPSYTITEKHRCGQLVKTYETGYRRLSVRECLRLQSFPDWWRFPIFVSTSRKYKLVGEAVPPILAYRLATHIGMIMGLRTKRPRKEDFDLPYFERTFIS